MGIEFLWAFVLLVVSFLFIVVMGYHALIKVVNDAGVLVRVLLLVWLAITFASFLFIPFVRIIPQIGGLAFIIATCVLIIFVMCIVASFFTRKKGA